MNDRDIQDIKQKLVDIETMLTRNHTTTSEAIRIVDNQVGKLTEIVGALARQSSA